MTPHELRIRLLAVRQRAVEMLAEDLKLHSPHLDNFAELDAELRAERRAIRNEILTLQRARERNSAYCGVPV